MHAQAKYRPDDILSHRHQSVCDLFLNMPSIQMCLPADHLVKSSHECDRVNERATFSVFLAIEESDYAQLAP
jgi:hypothetical protein